MEYLQFKFIKTTHKLIRSLNLDFVLILSYVIGPLYFILSYKNSFQLYKRRKKFKNLYQLNYNPLMVKINYVKYWIETLWLTNENFNKKIFKSVEIKNEHYISNLKNSGKGFIFALPHLGNWEMAIPVGNSLGLDLVAVAEPLSNKYVLSWFTSLREELGCEIIIGGKGQNTFKNIQQKINNRKHICLLSERSVNKSGIAVDFFGEVAAFPKGPVALALKSEVPIVPATFLKVNGKYTLIFSKPFYVPLFENEAQSIQQGVKVLAKSFEELISLDINQWHSIQPVWTNEY